ncbi:hypothetical protein EVAR_38056_1 [Eumeta japonica]|uniref:Uncharacterized protein n=1 Tax=Eumeta variegata TaxID=151549 RepID=A0A4C1W9V5_EUMVA|nr:hypothetical protein EVAR_38056_1 [Eumeta japonica]
MEIASNTRAPTSFVDSPASPGTLAARTPVVTVNQATSGAGSFKITGTKLTAPLKIQKPTTNLPLKPRGAGRGKNMACSNVCLLPIRFDAAPDRTIISRTRLFIVITIQIFLFGWRDKEWTRKPEPAPKSKMKPGSKPSVGPELESKA